MMGSGDDEAWAQLVCTTDIDTQPALIVKEKFVLGRNSDCDISHAGNKLISGNHCHVERDKKGKVWLYDTSTNGTLLNLKIKLCKGECRELSHGDEFHLVHKKGNSDDDIGYMFQDMKALKAETSSDFDDDTQEYEHNQTIPDPEATLADDEANAIATQCPAEKRKAAEEESEAAVKKLRLETEGVSASTSKDDSKREQTSVASTSKAGTSSSSDKPSTSKPGQDKEPEEDALAETLMCIICQELLHDCISLQPCMHSFCSGCYSEWMELSQECPSCRVKVDRINKNHIVNNLVEAYLKLNPDKKRPEADIQLLDAKNKITRDMLYPTNQVMASLEGSDTSYGTSGSEMDNRENEDDYEEDNEDEAYSDDDDGDNAGVPVAGGVNFLNPMPVNPFGLPFYGAANPIPAAQPRCRQCQAYNPATHPATAMAAFQTAQSAGDPDAKKFPTAPPFQCRPAANHVLCLCCLQPMPDRRNEFNFRPDCAVPPQQCSLCYRSFCHAYWGCHRPDCYGCLGKFKDMNFGRVCLDYLILDNAYESDILKSYLEAKSLSVRDLLGLCLAKMVNREYTCTDQARLESQNGINTPICYTCGLRNFKDLAYCYRKDITNDQLSVTATSRPDCHWGKNCRTQKNKPDHAKRYNHICEQTRVA